MPGFISAECIAYPNGQQFLVARPNANPDDPRADDFNGEIILGGFGLHLVDVTLGMGDLVSLGSEQTRAWQADRQ